MAAGSAAERAEAKGRASARKRGREVCCNKVPQSLHFAQVFNMFLSCPSRHA